MAGMQPVEFGSPERRLAGIHHAGNGHRRVPLPSVLMLNPFGQEAIRIHRLQRVVANRLARAGHDVLRFDWYGTGDSGGDDADVSLAGWIDDALRAHDCLLQASGRRLRVEQDPGGGTASMRPSVTWLACRLGATAALLAGTRLQSSPRRARHLLLWDPVLDGREYLRELVADHRRAIQTSYSLPSVARRLLAAIDPENPSEASGFALSPGFVRELQALRIAIPPAPTDRLTILRSAARQERRAPATRAQGSSGQAGVGFVDLETGFDWSSEEALNVALVPAPAVAAIIRAIADESRVSGPA